MPDQIFVQSVDWQGEPLEPEWLTEATLTLKINSLAPRLSLRVFNPDNILREERKMEPGGSLSVRFMDYFSKDAGEIAEFVIVSFYPDKDPKFLVLECLSKVAWLLSQKDHRVLRGSVSNILGSLLPEAAFDCGRFPTDNLCHLAGERRFELAARLAGETGGFFGLRLERGFFKSKKELFAEEDQAIYEHNNPGAGAYSIFEPRWLDQRHKSEDSKRFYMGWSDEEGLVVSNLNAGCPARMVSAEIPRQLDNIAAFESPALSFQAIGNGELRLGSPLKLVWHTGLPDRPLDETLPSRALAAQLIHHERRGLEFEFSTRVYCVV